MITNKVVNQYSWLKIKFKIFYLAGKIVYKIKISKIELNLLVLAQK